MADRALLAGYPLHLSLHCRFITGGILFIVALYTTKDGQYHGSNTSGGNLYETLYNPWKQLYQEGKITKVNDNGIFLFNSIAMYND